MNSIELKKLITESVLNFLNDARHWDDRGFFDWVPELPRVDKDELKNVPLFLKKGDNTFGLDKEN